MLKCKVNGKEVEVEEGTSVIEAFKKAGEDIAHYCYHPGLSVAGVCRLCMCKVEGNPRLQIACNTQVQEGMEVTNQSDDVKECVKWGLDFHLINHPLDCPICDQAGECELQNQYMKFGQYDSDMAEVKVKKHKAKSLGEKVMLDSERCILCSRCVRFTSEVSKTHELGIFNRGDRSEIGTFEGKPLNNNYSVNTVDICPVGALTSQDFRFRQRVWYLKDKETICNGCSTGCNVKVYYNEEGLFRVKPVYNKEVNGYWMCDFGRDIYKFVNKDHRLADAKVFKSGQWQLQKKEDHLNEAQKALETAGGSLATVVTGQYSTEEYQDLFQYLTQDLKSKQVYHWVNNPSSFDDYDDLLIRGDKNPNTTGLLDQMAQFSLQLPWKDLEDKIESGQISTLLVLAPENYNVYPSLEEKLALFEKVKKVIWLSSCKNEKVDEKLTGWQIPMKSFVEKPGTYKNFKGLEQKVKPISLFNETALSVNEWLLGIRGQLKKDHSHTDEVPHMKTNHFLSEGGKI